MQALYRPDARFASCPPVRCAPTWGAAAATVTLCERDVGGPLFKGYAWQAQTLCELFGVASYWMLVEGGAPCPPVLPNMYTRVEAVREWVWSVMYASY